MAIAVIESPDNEKFLSYASIWEMGIKYSNKKLKFPRPCMEFIRENMEANGFEILDVNLKHIDALLKLPFHHKDPFDRMIIAQSVTESMPVVTVDEFFPQYPIETLW
jgi:PIN domain nuclease of toxin-antitoxin system